MLQKTSHALLLIALCLTSQSLNAEANIEGILAELQVLRKQVATLETRIENLENEKAATIAAADSNEVQPRQRKTWFDNMRVELKKAEVRASGAWTSPDAWNNIQTGLTIDEVIAFLGEPTDRKFSVRRDTDEILHYRGDLEGSGEPVEGEIRIYKGKVRRFTLPDFPTEN